MIARIWHGTTTKENASAYEQLVTTKIFREIEAKTGEGFHGVELFKRETAEEVEFTTMIWFKDLETIKKLTGEDYETAYVPEEARKILSHFDEKVIHSHLLYSTRQ
ncbi:hypothetical protein [Salinimicrobium terrae]|uniref:hypothetical protein n=1 Tax=Salinimicrobium terrae TaxID=470866 RepID=UPI0003FEB01B|nr:hypothetical protein [Salinimicrobium terrae]